jgi:hypothetical protein
LIGQKERKILLIGPENRNFLLKFGYYSECGIYLHNFTNFKGWIAEYHRRIAEFEATGT